MLTETGAATPALGASAGSRYVLLDMIRGVALVSMILYHAAWDLTHLFGVDWPWFYDTGAFLWQQSICWTFIFLSGFCAPMGRHTARRGLLVLGGGCLVSMVTVIWMPETAVRFGVLTLLGSCLLLAECFKKPLERISPTVGFTAGTLLFLLVRGISDGVLGVGGWTLLKLPGTWFRNDFTTYLGLPAPGFSSTDYFPLFPWCFLFLMGYFAFRLCAKRGILVHLTAGRTGPLASLGRHTLPIYLLHQPVLYSMFFMCAKVAC